MKGQTALEYLITYGWAILVILVVLAVLWYYGIFNPARWAGESVTEGSAFKIVDKNLVSSGTLTLSLGNKVGTTVSITSLNVTGDIIGYKIVTPAETVVAGANILAPYQITVTGLGTASVGSFARFTVTIHYDVVGGIGNKTDVAQFSIKVS